MPEKGTSSAAFEKLLNLNTATTEAANAENKKSRQRVSRLEAAKAAVHDVDANSAEYAKIVESLKSANIVEMPDYVKGKRQVMAEAAASLELTLDKINHEITAAKNHNPREQRLIDDATATHASLEAELETLNGDGMTSVQFLQRVHQDAKATYDNRGFFGGIGEVFSGSRKGVMVAAESAYSSASRRAQALPRFIEQALADIDAAKAQALKWYQERLSDLDFETFQTEFLARSEALEEVLKNSLTALSAEVQASSDLRVETVTRVTQVQQAEASIQETIRTKTAELGQKETAIQTLTPGTTEHADALQELSDLRIGLENLNGELGACEALRNSLDIIQQRMELDQKSLQDSRNTVAAKLAKHTEETKMFSQAFQNQLAQIAEVSNILASEVTEETSAKLEQAGIDLMVRSSTAAKKSLVATFERDADRLRLLKSTSQAVSDIDVTLQNEAKAALARFKDVLGEAVTDSDYYKQMFEISDEPETETTN